MGNGQLFLYPQAVLKQGRYKSQPPFVEADVLLDFNAKSHWYFGDGNDLQLPNGTVDFCCIFELILVTAVHELIHGLGFSSNLYDYQSLMNRPIPYLAPSLVETEGGKVYFSPITAFDGLIFSSYSARQLGADLSTLPARKGTRAEFLEKIESNPTAIAAAQNLYRTAVSGSAMLQLSGYTHLGLYTPREFSPGTSIVHVDKTLMNTKEFLMTPFNNNNETLKTIMVRNGHEYVIGPKLMSVMEQIGYATVNKPIVNEFTIVETYGTDLYNPALAKREFYQYH